MVHQLRMAVLVLFLGLTAMVVWNYVAQADRVSQSNVPGIDPGNPLAQYGIESDEHKAYVSAKMRNLQYEIVEIETGVVTGAVVLWILLPIFSREWLKTNGPRL